MHRIEAMNLTDLIGYEHLLSNCFSMIVLYKLYIRVSFNTIFNLQQHTLKMQDENVTTTKILIKEFSNLGSNLHSEICIHLYMLINK